MLNGLFLISCIAHATTHKSHDTVKLNTNIKYGNVLPELTDFVNQNLGRNAQTAKLFKFLSEKLKRVSIKINVKSDNEQSTNETNEYFTTQKVVDPENDLNLDFALDIIDILFIFGPRPLEKCWDHRPNLTLIKMEDLKGDNLTKQNFLDHISLTKELYIKMIDLCDKMQFDKFNRTIPDHLIVNDLLNTAYSFNVSLLMNEGKSFDIYHGVTIKPSKFVIEDLKGSNANKQRFLNSIHKAEFILIEQAIQGISDDIYGIPLPLHIEAEFVIAMANYYNVNIISIGGTPFDMNWHRRFNNFVGYPPDSSGATDYVREHCFKMEGIFKQGSLIK